MSGLFVLPEQSRVDFVFCYKTEKIAGNIIPETHFCISLAVFRLYITFQNAQIINAIYPQTVFTLFQK